MCLFHGEPAPACASAAKGGSFVSFTSLHMLLVGQGQLCAPEESEKLKKRSDLRKSAERGSYSGRSMVMLMRILSGVGLHLPSDSTLELMFIYVCL